MLGDNLQNVPFYPIQGPYRSKLYARLMSRQVPPTGITIIKWHLCETWQVAVQKIERGWGGGGAVKIKTNLKIILAELQMPDPVFTLEWTAFMISNWFSQLCLPGHSKSQDAVVARQWVQLKWEWKERIQKSKFALKLTVS